LQAGAKPAALSSSIDWKKPVRRHAEYRNPNTRATKMFAVFKTGGKQYRVAAEDVLKVDKIKGEPGEVVEFGDVLAVGGESVTLGAPTVAGATVAAEVLDQGRGGKIIAFKKRRRKNSRRKRGHRQEFTLLRITEILTDGKKPNKTPPPRPKRAPAAKTAEAADATASAAGDDVAEKPSAGSGKTKGGGKGGKGAGAKAKSSAA
jgi:large subunit ribosomal protein L21